MLSDLIIVNCILLVILVFSKIGKLILFVHTGIAPSYASKWYWVYQSFQLLRKRLFIGKRGCSRDATIIP